MRKALIILSILISSCASTKYQSSQRAKVKIPVAPPTSHVDLLLTFGAVTFLIIVGVNSSKKK